MLKRKKNNKVTVRYQSAVLFVHDIILSKKFYQEIFGLEILMDFGKALNFKEGLSLWEIPSGHEIIARFGRIPSEPIPSHELYFELDDIHDFEQLIDNKNIRKAHSIKEETWGQRTIRILDPDNHIIEIGESMKVFIKRLYDSGLTIEEISIKTSVPQNDVGKILGIE